MGDFVSDLVVSFVTLFVIMDPFSSIPVYMALAKNFSEKEKSESVDKAVLLAGGIIVVFLLFGLKLLEVMTISLASFKIGGGIVLGLLGLQIVLGFSLGKKEAKNYNVLAVVIATPLLTGPGVITSSIILSEERGILVTLVAAALSLFLSWVLLRKSFAIRRVVGEQGIDIFSKIMGMLLVALAVEFIRSGLGLV